MITDESEDTKVDEVKEEVIDKFIEDDVANIEESISRDIARNTGAEEVEEEVVQEEVKDDEVEIDGVTYKKADIEAAIKSRKEQPVQVDPVKVEESEEIKALKAQLESPTVKGDDAVEKIIKNQIEQQKRIDYLEAKEKADEVNRKNAEAKTKIQTWKEEAEKHFDIKLPAIDSPEFKKYIDASNTGNPLINAVYALHPDKFKGEPKAPSVPKSLPKSKSAPASSGRTDLDSEYIAVLTEKAKKAGMKVEDVLKLVK